MHPVASESSRLAYCVQVRPDLSVARYVGRYGYPLRPCSVALGPFRCPIQNDHFEMEERPFSHQKWTPSGMGPAQPNRALGHAVG